MDSEPRLHAPPRPKPRAPGTRSVRGVKQATDRGPGTGRGTEEETRGCLRSWSSEITAGGGHQDSAGVTEVNLKRWES